MSADNEKIASLAADVKKLWTPDSRGAGAHCAPAGDWFDLPEFAATKRKRVSHHAEVRRRSL